MASLASPIRALFTFSGVAFYLLLAVLGEGGFGPFLSHAPLVAMTIAFFAIAILSLFAGGSMSAGVREDRGNRWVLSAFTAISLAAGFLAPYTDRIGFWTFGGDTVRWFGVAFGGIGSLVRILPVFVLGDRFSGLVAIQPGHALVTTGMYATVRNPSYVGMLMTSVGWALAFRSGVGLLFAALLPVPLVARMHSEERLLHDQFGAEYDAYRARTWRLIPGIY